MTQPAAITQFFSELDAPQILACARHMAQNMLQAETSRKASLRKKQQFAGMSSSYLEKVLDAGLAQLASI